MVKETKKDDYVVYVCEECDMAYKEKEMAEKCEAFCNKYHSCSLEITKHAIE